MSTQQLIDAQHATTQDLRVELTEVLALLRSAIVTEEGDRIMHARRAQVHNLISIAVREYYAQLMWVSDAVACGLGDLQELRPEAFVPVQPITPAQAVTLFDLVEAAIFDAEPPAQ